MDRSGYISLNSNYLLGGVDLKSTILLIDELYFDKLEFKFSEDFVLNGKHMAPKVRNVYGDEIVEDINSKIRDVEFLIELKILLGVDPVKSETAFISQFPANKYSEFFKEAQEQLQLPYFRSTAIINSIYSLSVMDLNGYKPYHENKNAIFLSDVLSSIENKSIIPILNSTNLFMKDIERYSTDKMVLDIVLSKFPTIQTQNLSWERILDFKRDKEAITNRLRLRNWMTEIAKTSLSYVEIKEKLDYLLNEYETHLRRHEFEFKYSILKETIITSMEILEKIVQFKFSELAKVIFNIGNHNLRLMDIKENAPGKEVALFHQLKEKLP